MTLRIHSYGQVGRGLVANGLGRIRSNWGRRSTLSAAMRRGACGLIVLTGVVSLAQAADPQPYRVDFASTGIGQVDSTLKATSQLATLRTTAPVDPFGLVARARSDIGRLTTVLESFGYYQ